MASSLPFACLLYHGLGEQERWGYLRQTDFRRQLDELGSTGYRGLSVGQLETILESSPDGRFFGVTFDDGHRSCVIAAEILQGLGFSATFFLATRACQTDINYLDAKTIRSLSEIAEIGSHTVNHKLLTRLPDADLRSELLDSKKWLEDVIGKEVRFVSAPGGALSARVVERSLQCGYSLVCGSGVAINRASKVRETRVIHRVAIDYANGHQAGPLAKLEKRAWFRRRLRGLLLAAPKALLSRDSATPLRRYLVRLWDRQRRRAY